MIPKDVANRVMEEIRLEEGAGKFPMKTESAVKAFIRDGCKWMGISEQEMNCRCHYHRIVHRRWVIMWVMREVGGMTFDRISEFTERETGTIWTAVKQFELNIIKTEPFKTYAFTLEMHWKLISELDQNGRIDYPDLLSLKTNGTQAK